ncbi:basic amino acid ABC transporter substrate-binding protein [Thiospirochaeta perfilievii]|uniref:Basic amino acid ABC transporter substrate-binding protein n=1 Tax=Thiospirochaeta perfilievii TaxID=252967 RepID=A0A5C1QJC8_9SPIO|nr:basic amino acid ABC transporter substrate-binding protein [Thiospirochaeta perfilievii]QEN06272.1 basic amino acid ABC transporter substrate-binding protein [Thiospirochaeta perfilievii]
MKNIIKGVFLILLVSLLFVGCQKKGNDKLVFASDATWPPMEFVDEAGDIVGFDMDLIAAVAEEAGFEYEVKNTNWDGIFAGLANGAYDGIISSVTITEERQKAMNFTTPYINAGQILLLRVETTSVEKIEDMAGMKVGTQQGTTGDFVVEEISSIDRRAYDDIGLAVEDLLNGNVDGVVCDSPIAADYVMNNPAFKGKLKIVGEPFTEEFFGIAVQKNNEELLKTLNDALDKVIASGKRDELINKWLR